MQTLVEIGSDGASPQIGEIQPFCDFSDCPTFFLDPAYRSNRWADFRASASNDVYPCKDGSFGG